MSELEAPARGAALHKAPCERCGHVVERRRLKRHYRSKGCQRAVQLRAAERQTSVEAEIEAAGPPPPPTNYNPDLRRVACPRCGDADVGVGRLLQHYRTKRCREACRRRGLDPDDPEAFPPADENKQGNGGADEPAWLEEMHDFMGRKSGLQPVTVRVILRWTRRFVRFAGRPPEALGETACDQDAVDRFVVHLRDDCGLGLASLTRAVDALRWLLDYQQVTRRVDDAAAIDSQRRNLKLLRARLAKDEVAQANGGLYGKSVEELEARGQWASLDELRHVLKRGRKLFSRLAKELLEAGRAPTSAEARHMTAYLFFATSFGGTPVRTGTLEALTPDEAQQLIADGSVTTETFKTAATHGAVTIEAPEWLRDMYEVYRGVVHLPLAGGHEQERFFLVGDGRPAAKMGREVKALTKALCGKEVHMTRLRQILETASKEHLTAEEQEAVSGAMTHSSRVANKFYQKVRAKDRARRAREALVQVTGADEVMQAKRRRVGSH